MSKISDLNFNSGDFFKRNCAKHSKRYVPKELLEV